MRRIATTSTALLFAVIGAASARSAETETVGQFLMSMPARILDPVIDYCSENVPEVKNDLLKERAGFIDKLAEAGKPLVDKLKNDPEFNAPVQENMRQEIAKVNLHALSIFKQQDSAITCRRVLANIQNATVDDLRQVVEDNYQKYLDAAQPKKSD